MPPGFTPVILADVANPPPHTLVIREFRTSDEAGAPRKIQMVRYDGAQKRGAYVFTRRETNAASWLPLLKRPFKHNKPKEGSQKKTGGGKPTGLQLPLLLLAAALKRAHEEIGSPGSPLPWLDLAKMPDLFDVWKDELDGIAGKMNTWLGTQERPKTPFVDRQPGKRRVQPAPWIRFKDISVEFEPPLPGEEEVADHPALAALDASLPAKRGLLWVHRYAPWLEPLPIGSDPNPPPEGEPATEFTVLFRGPQPATLADASDPYQTHPRREIDRSFFPVELDPATIREGWYECVAARGMGKTTAALQHARRAGGKGYVVYWLDGSLVTEGVRLPDRWPDEKLLVIVDNIDALPGPTRRAVLATLPGHAVVLATATVATLSGSGRRFRRCSLHADDLYLRTDDTIAKLATKPSWRRTVNLAALKGLVRELNAQDALDFRALISREDSAPAPWMWRVEGIRDHFGEEFAERLKEDLAVSDLKATAILFLASLMLVEEPLSPKDERLSLLASTLRARPGTTRARPFNSVDAERILRRLVDDGIESPEVGNRLATCFAAAQMPIRRLRALQARIRAGYLPGAEMLLSGFYHKMIKITKNDEASELLKGMEATEDRVAKLAKVGSELSDYFKPHHPQRWRESAPPLLVLSLLGEAGELRRRGYVSDASNLVGVAESVLARWPAADAREYSYLLHYERAYLCLLEGTRASLREALAVLGDFPTDTADVPSMKGRALRAKILLRLGECTEAVGILEQLIDGAGEADGPEVRRWSLTFLNLLCEARVGRRLSGERDDNADDTFLKLEETAKGYHPGGTPPLRRDRFWLRALLAAERDDAAAVSAVFTEMEARGLEPNHGMRAGEQGASFLALLWAAEAEQGRDSADLLRELRELRDGLDNRRGKLAAATGEARFSNRDGGPTGLLQVVARALFQEPEG